MWKKGNTCALLVKKWIGTATMDNFIKVSQKIKNRTTMQSDNYTLVYLSEEIENNNLKRYIHPCCLCSIIYNSQDMEAT